MLIQLYLLFPSSCRKSFFGGAAGATVKASPADLMIMWSALISTITDYLTVHFTSLSHNCHSLRFGWKRATFDETQPSAHFFLLACSALVRLKQTSCENCRFESGIKFGRISSRCQHQSARTSTRHPSSAAALRLFSEPLWLEQSLGQFVREFWELYPRWCNCCCDWSLNWASAIVLSKNVISWWPLKKKKNPTKAD